MMSPPLLMRIYDLPFLNPTEWIRAKVKRLADSDMDDVAWMVGAWEWYACPNFGELADIQPMFSTSSAATTTS
jgi:hypothetical protein